MVSPLVVRLTREINDATDNRQRGELEARMAGYLARIGDFDLARANIGRLRLEFGAGQNGRVTILIMIAEALVHHYESLDLTALDRLTRAQLLSRLLKESDLEAITSAWRAHIEFDCSKFKDMFLSLKEATSKADLNNNEARARISNVLCKIATLCGDQTRARQFFLNGRNYALKEGDQASIEALQHNRAAFRLAWARTARCLGDLSQTELTETGVEVATAKSLQNITGIRALSSYIKLCDARLAILEDRFSEALELFSLVGESDPFPRGSWTHQMIELEKAYCLGQLKRVNDAMVFFHPDKFQDIAAMDCDEQVVVRWMQTELAKLDPRFGDPSEIEQQLADATAEYYLFTKEMRVNLDSISWS